MSAYSDCVKCWSTPCDCGFKPHCNQKAHKAAVAVVKAVLQYNSQEVGPEVWKQVLAYIEAAGEDTQASNQSEVVDE